MIRGIDNYYVGTDCTVGTDIGTSSSNDGVIRPAAVVFTAEPLCREGGSSMWRHNFVDDIVNQARNNYDNNKVGLIIIIMIYNSNK